MTTAEVILKAALGALLVVAGGCQQANEDCGRGGCYTRPGAWLNYTAYTPVDVLPMADLYVEQDGAYRLKVSRATEAPIEEPGCGTEGHDACTGVAQQDLCMSGALLDDELSTVEQLVTPELLDAYSVDDVEPPGNASIELDVEEPEEDLSVALDFDPDASVSADTEMMLTAFDALVVELFGRGEYCRETDAQIATEGEWLLP